MNSSAKMADTLAGLSFDHSQDCATLRLRKDLVVLASKNRHRPVWIVKDPLSLEYFKFSKEEFSILSMLKDATGLDDLKARFETKFAPQKMTVEMLKSFLGNLYQSGLLVAQGSGQGAVIQSRQRRRKSLRRLATLTNLLAIRTRGIDPERMLNWLYPRCRFIFSPWFVGSGFVLMLAALMIVFAYAGSTLNSGIAELYTYISVRNLAWLALTLTVTKMFHELAHALACKHFGGECHEFGIMLLVFTPCLYCDVSDSWIMPSRWHRIAVAAAGIWSDLVFASIGTLGWFFTVPGFLNNVCFNVMLVCGVGTVMLNGNPLLRYDGYYILSDLLDIPNLWSESRRSLRRVCGRFFFRDMADHQNERTMQLCTYGLLSSCYRIVVLCGILLFVYGALSRIGLTVFAHLITASVVVSLFLSIGAGVIKLVRNGDFFQRLRLMRFIVGGALLCTVLFVLLAVPLRSSIRAIGVIELLDAERVYIPHSGNLVESVEAGEKLKADHLLARLEDPVLTRDIARLANQIKRQKLRVQHLEMLRFQTSRSLEQIPVAEEFLRDLQNQLEEKQRKLKALRVLAPSDGIVVSPPNRRWPKFDRAQLTAWEGSPLSRQNLGCHLERGTLFCLIADPHKHQAIVIVDQSEIRRVKEGQRVRMKLEMLPGKTIRGRIGEIARRELENVPPAFAAGRELPSRLDPSGTAKPLGTSYQIQVLLEDHDFDLVMGAQADVIIEAAPETFGRRVFRFLSRSFRLPT